MAISNLVLRERAVLAERNYIRKADPSVDYWFDFADRKLQKYVSRLGENFNLVIVGSASSETDFFAIPFPAVRHMLTADSLAEAKAGDHRRRWIGNIVNGEMRISKHPGFLDVGRYYGTPHVLYSSDTWSEDYANDYAIENRKIEIAQRVKQSLFRKRVLENFESRCCITGICETELLVSSHIIPWSHRIETRLDPANGLCLSATLDPLFDKGFFSLTDELTIIPTKATHLLSESLREVLQSLSGRMIRQPVRVPLKREYLAYHRSHVLKT